MPTQLVLRATAGELAGQAFPLEGPARWRLGRSRSCTLRLEGDSTVSRHHCILAYDPPTLWVQDLGSLNGTYLNGENIGRGVPGDGANATMMLPSRRPLGAGDELRVGQNVFCVKSAGEDENRFRGHDTEWAPALLG